MSLRVVGAGIARTGTLSLHLALSALLRQDCYHMRKIGRHPEHVAQWEHAFADGSPPWGWDVLFEGYGAAVGEPTSVFWRELHITFPEALVVLSVRRTDEWWRSFSQTILPVLKRHVAHPDAEHGRTVGLGYSATIRHLTTEWADESTAKAAYEAHNDEVRSVVPPDRLVEWSPADGWGPLCRALEVPVPAEPFPHRNSTSEVRAEAGL